MSTATSPAPSSDPLLQPFTIKALTLRDRMMSTAHEPAYTEDGLPKDRYRLYHAEKAKGGIGLTVIGGSSVVAPDSPQAFGNILLYKDEAVRWLKGLADDQRLESVRRDGNALVATVFDEYGKTRTERRADQVVVENGTTPVDDLYFALKPRSSNLGEVDYAALLDGGPQGCPAHDGSFLLYRIGDAVSSRNIHAAIHDALRLAKDF